MSAPDKERNDLIIKMLKQGRPDTDIYRQYVMFCVESKPKKYPVSYNTVLSVIKREKKKLKA